MRRILILGGIHEARTLAEELAGRDFDLIYSVAGNTPAPQLPCEVRLGGFGGPDGLRDFLLVRRVDLLVDATHPYADRMSFNAARAARRSGVPIWAYRRPSWVPQPGDDWRWCFGWNAITHTIASYTRPFFTIGQTPFNHLGAIMGEQRWLVRSLQPSALHHPRLTTIAARGPFSVLAETRLMRERHIDVLISKNSGGDAVAAKIAAARHLKMPVAMLARPSVSNVDRVFLCTQDLLAALSRLDC